MVQIIKVGFLLIVDIEQVVQYGDGIMLFIWVQQFVDWYIKYLVEQVEQCCFQCCYCVNFQFEGLCFFVEGVEICCLIVFVYLLYYVIELGDFLVYYLWDCCQQCLVDDFFVGCFVDVGMVGVIG